MGKTPLLTMTTAGIVLSLCLACAPAQAASSDGLDENLSRIERILGDLDRAREVITGRPSGAEDLAKAQERLRAREADLERARVDAMCAATGKSRDAVIAMRASGRGWGDIASALGVSPRFVGIGPDGKDAPGKGYEKSAAKGKKKGWKGGMPPGQAKKPGN